DVEQALERMATHGVRRVPVLNDERCVAGIVALDDLLRVHAEQGVRLLDVVNKERNREQRVRR
ncbi:MAG: CBS domain-containing protein, partial [Steroidobacteraceae bacterium]